MLIAAIITGIIGLVLSILWIVSWVREKDVFESNPWYFWLGLVFNLLWAICFVSSLNVQIGTENLTGYIYSAEDQFGYTTAHIRYSQNAGMDVQPDFCVKTDSEAGRKIHEFAGSGKATKVTIPSYFYFANSPFACGTTKTTIELVK